MVTLVTAHYDTFAERHQTNNAVKQQVVLHVLADNMATEAVALQYAACMRMPDSDIWEMLAPLDFEMMDAEVVAALQRSLRLLAIACADFRPEHWDILCSLHHVSDMSLCLLRSHLRSDVPGYEVQNMQLTNLRKLTFMYCKVSLQPMLQHLSALTRLTGLHFHKCPGAGGWAALSGDMPQLHSLVHLTLNACNLTTLPCLQQLVHLEMLNLDANPALRDVEQGLRSLTSLHWLSMRSSTPISEHTLKAIKKMPALWEFDISGQKWTPAKYFHRLQRRVDAWNVNVIL